MSNLTASFLDSKAIEEVRFLAETALGARPADKDEALVYDAAVDFKAAMLLGRRVHRSWSALRRHVFNVYQSGSWAIVPIPIRDVHGEPTGDYSNFKDFREWFDGVASDSDLNSTYRSVLWNNTTILLPAIANNPIVDPDGKTITVDQVLELPESHWEIISPPATGLASQVRQGIQGAAEKLGSVIGAAAKTSRRKLKKTLSDQGLTGTPVKIDGYEVMTEVCSAIVLLPKNDAEYKRLKMLLSDRTDIRTTNPEGLKAILSEVLGNDSEDSEFTEYLSRKQFELGAAD